MTTAQLMVAEPPPQYLVRPPLVVDCSIVASAMFSEPTHAEADAQITGRTLHAPFLLQNEVVSVALRKQKEGYGDVVREGLAAIASLPIEFHRIEEAAVFDLASRYALSGYDAAYLWLAAALRYPLATFDKRLAAAARQHLSSLE